MKNNQKEIEKEFIEFTKTNYKLISSLWITKQLVKDLAKVAISILSKSQKDEMVLANKRPKIVCLCGSTKFKEAFLKANKEETLKGNIVLSVGCFPHSDSDEITLEQKILLDRLHFAKIYLADEILVLNVNEYVGESTENEIQYAKSHNKKIRFLEKERNEIWLRY